MIKTEATLLLKALRLVIENDDNAFRSLKHFAIGVLKVTDEEIDCLKNDSIENLIHMWPNVNPFNNKENEFNPTLIKMMEIIQNNSPELIPFLKALLIYPKYKEAVLEDFEAINNNLKVSNL